MYKTKIQQLCHSRSWNLPDYQTIRDGPDHNPRFTSTVTVNGLHFQSPEPTRSSKEAQNNAAKLAFHHFSQPVNPSPSPSPSPNPNPSPPLSLPQLSSFPQLPSFPGCSFPQPSLSLPATSTTPSFVSFGPNNGGVDSGVLQPKAVEGFQTSQISSPVKATTMTTVDQKNMQHLYKNQLQNFAHKKNLNLPVYSSEWEGPPHALRFKCKVTIDGQTFESSKFFSTLKDAEHAAAEVALMSLSPGGVQEDQTGLYKNLLQEFVQKEGFRFPSYNTNRYGESHMPTFVSQVEIEGESFTGEEAKSKKQAETSAAKVAYMTLKERKGISDQSSLFPMSAHHGQAPEFSSDRSEANVITGLQHHANLKSPVSLGIVTKNQLDKSKAHHGQAPEFSSERSEPNVITGLQHHANLKSPVSPGLVTKNQLDKSKAHHGQAPEFPSDPNVINGLQHNANLKSPVNPGLVTKNQLDKSKEPVTVTEKKGSSSSGNTNGCAENYSLSNVQSEPSLSDSTNLVSDTSKMPSTQVSTPSCRNKVVVYSCNTNVEIEGGGSMMPISDDKWVAYSYSH